MGEIEISLVVRGAAEDGAGSIPHQHEVRDIDRQFDALCERVFDSEAGVVAALLRGLDCLFTGAELAAFLDKRRGLRVGAGDVFGERMVRGDGAEAGAENGIRSGGVDP